MTTRGDVELVGLVESLQSEQGTMPKPPLREPFGSLSDNLIKAMEDGLHDWRPDLSYPDSRSDMQACVLGVLARFELLPRRVPLKLSDMVENVADVAVCKGCFRELRPREDPDWYKSR